MATIATKIIPLVYSASSKRICCTECNFAVIMQGIERLFYGRIRCERTKLTFGLP